MQLTHEHCGKYLLIKADGRLDASWSEYFAGMLLGHIRQGNHHLVIDAEKISFLSSAGIRVLIIIYKELLTVRGDFQIINAGSFVANTLKSTGLDSWLVSEPIAGLLYHANVFSSGTSNYEVHVINEKASLSLSVPAAWQPWQAVYPESAVKLSFPENTFALGIASAAGSFAEARDRFGEFLAIAGNVIFQPPEEGIHPDYLFSEKNFIPEMFAIQALCCSGEISHLLRFAPDGETQFFNTSRLAASVLSITGSDAAGFIILGEIEGLVGATLIKSPGIITNEGAIKFPEIRDWISFTGERVFAGQQALMFGIAKKTKGSEKKKLLAATHPDTGLATHIHAAVFPYQPLQNGKIDLLINVQKFFGGPPPQAIMHLANDTRAAVGLGQSTLIRGACWCAPIINSEVLL